MPVPGTQYHKEKKYDYVKDPQTGQLAKKFRDVSVPEESTSVCDISKQTHIDHLLKLSMYEEYDQEKIDAERAKKEVNPMKGFAVEKYFDKGYVAVDKRKKPFKYAGENGTWVEKSGDLVPFKSELETFSFIKEEAEFVDNSDELEDTSSQVLPKKTAKG